FNAPLYLGIASSKLAVALNEKNVEKSELDIKESIASTYYLILVTERTLDILEKNISDLNATLNSTKAMYAAGMAELTDVDQVTTNVTSVTNSKTSTLTTLELNYNMLKFQLGVPVNTQIVLTQTLEDILAEIDVDLLLQNTFDYQQNIDYKLISDQVKLSELSLKSEMSSTLPTLATYYNYGTNGMGDKLNDLRWFQNSVAGLSLSVPIFASGQRYSKIKKARTELEKSKNTQNLLVEQLLIQEQQLRYNLLNANIQYNSQKENIEVAKRVYKNVENKFKQGVASSLELTQSNMQYLTAESNYVNALLTLLQSKLALDKLMNNL
ncbi:MAG: TolC family protein, partial [Bacteroidales bacterium]|nr:TolC family protein [Bacteroidales bacterium]